MQNRDLSSIVHVAAEALETIGKLAGGATADTALAALAGITAVVTVVKRGLGGGPVTADEVLGELAVLKKQLASADASADAALHEKFHLGE